jgi:hypothetical protein
MNLVRWLKALGLAAIVLAIAFAAAFLAYLTFLMWIGAGPPL